MWRWGSSLACRSVASRRGRGVCSHSVVDFKVRELILHSNSGSTLNSTKAMSIGSYIMRGISPWGLEFW
jgi:hypothetical protein